jgi:hypothetical protein
MAGAALCAACSGSSTSPGSSGGIASATRGISSTVTPDPRPRPAQVASQASQVLGETEFGQAGAANESLTSMQCRDGVLEVATTRRVVYAELPCDRALSDAQSQTFLSQTVHVRVVPVSPAKLYINSTKAGSAEFTVGRIWVQSGA